MPTVMFNGREVKVTENSPLLRNNPIIPDAKPNATTPANQPSGAMPNNSPSTGMGGFTYGSGNSAADRALDANMKLWASDPAAKQAEIDRALGVIKTREDQGLDVTAQKKHLYGTLGYQDPVDKTQLVPQGYTPPSWTPPSHTPLSWNDATGRASAQLDPLFQRAVNNIIQNRATGDMSIGEMAVKRGGQHSGLAVDALAKNYIAAAGKMADADAQKASQTAEMATALVNRDQDRADRLRSQAFQEFMGTSNLGLDAARFNRGIFESDRGFDYQVGRDSINDIFRNDQFDWTRLMDEAALTGYYGDNRTLPAQQFDWSRFMDEVDRTGVMNGRRTLQGLTTDAQLANMSADNARAQIQLEMQQTEFQNNQAAQTFAGTLMDDLGLLEDEQDVVEFLNLNAGEISSKLGVNAYNNIRGSALAPFEQARAAKAQLDSAASDRFSQAMKLAQSDPMWPALDTAGRNNLVNQYLKMFPK